MSPLSSSQNAEPASRAVSVGQLFLRVAVGLMIFFIHGCHKLADGWAYFQHGTPWPLAEEVAGMRAPAPLATAVVATLIQFICPLFLIVGWRTRLSAVLLAGALGGAVLQNVLAGRDPQLAGLYLLTVSALIMLGGGRFSCEARLAASRKASR